MSPAFDVGSCSEKGLRDYQQDAVGHRVDGGGLVAAVADGVGSHEGSDKSAQAAVATVLRVAVLEASASSATELGHVARAAVAEAASEVVRDQVARHYNGSTTLTMVLLAASGVAVVAHVGDSRVYLLRAGRLTQLTQDHRIHRHVLVRYLGAFGLGDDAEPDVLATTVLPGDVFLLSTDGVHDTLSHAQLAAVLEDAASAQVAAEALVHAALASGSRDNCTALVARVAGDAPETVRGAA
ncbi:serine/threonine-protein phosphatase [Corallococcus sp. bb12-1]|uniref:PP2C family protein-serine/threonine phosphatase n=1 Tax=Corallococcus sp. bb12-1 TaxID=2996784 RepID=UPI002270DE17|nr:PP2C family serine/threonine-protein phosphatase [Corallococcus sp. bb12-1]MCY1047586.1 serine/threonine-protein phosphatase [Corallococcus sp. bb12-1]